MIWLALGSLVIAAFIVALPPLLKTAKAGSRGESDLAVYRDQLTEVDRDQERGVVSAAEADAARTEIKRRILALVPSLHAERPTGAGPAPLLTAMIAVGIVGVSLAIYLTLGRPSLPALPYRSAAEQQMTAERMLQQVDAMVGNLAERLQRRPNDPEGWRMLGWSYLQLGRVGEGVEALKRAVVLDGGNGALRSQLGEAIVRQANGQVTQEAIAVFDEALKLDAKDPRARFYKGIALMQAGSDREALDALVAILRDGPRDAEWFQGIQTEARALAVKLKLDPRVVP